jgi:hypothetical protein
MPLIKERSKLWVVIQIVWLDFFGCSVNEWSENAGELIEVDEYSNTYSGKGCGIRSKLLSDPSDFCDDRDEYEEYKKAMEEAYLECEDDRDNEYIVDGFDEDYEIPKDIADVFNDI